MRAARVAFCTALVVVASWFPAAPASADDCATSSSAEGLNAFFNGDDAAGLAGGDYPHAIELPDGRTLWYFQDAFFGQGGRLRDDRFAHNAAMVQDGDCFELLDPPGGDGNSWIGSWVEQSLWNWVWPLDAEVGADGHLWLFLAEVQNPNGAGAARGALPVGTWTARYTLPDLQLVGMEPAPDASRSLFGYSITSDEEWSYLYANCYRQFDAAGTIGYDPGCSPFAYVARVPVGEFDRELEYWTGDGWSADRSGRTPVLTAENSMPVSVQRFGDVYVAASGEDDWFGDDVVVYTAPAPQGPWTEAVRYTPETRCGDDCNNYGAFVLPDLEGDRVVIAHSNNAWDMQDAFDDASLYRIDVRTVDVPGVSAENLARKPDLALARTEPATEPEAEPTGDTPVAADAAVDADSRSTERLGSPAGITVPLDDGSTWIGALWAGVRTALLVAVVAVLMVPGLGVVRSARRSRGRRRRTLERLHSDRAGRIHREPSRREV